MAWALKNLEWSSCFVSGKRGGAGALLMLSTAFPWGIRPSTWEHRKGFVGHHDSTKKIVFGPWQVSSPLERQQLGDFRVILPRNGNATKQRPPVEGVAKP